MNWNLLLFFLFLNLVSFEASRRSRAINNLIQALKRRYAGHRTIMKSPRYPEHLPPAEPILPGHTLIRPALQMLKSSVKYPKADLENTAVYGNLDNLGVTYGKSPYRVMYSGFRRTNDIVESTIVQAVKNIIKSNKSPSDTNVIFLEALNSGEKSSLGILHPELEVVDIPSNDLNDASEDLSSSSEEDEDSQARRSSRYHRLKTRVKYRNRIDIYPSSNETELSSGESSATDESSDYDRNPGNPFTLHKGKYKQNWMWNHYLDGDHVNVNPFAPKLNKLGPNGVDLFFGRKWWYFHQDDYKPLS